MTLLNLTDGLRFEHLQGKVAHEVCIPSSLRLFYCTNILDVIRGTSN